MNEKEIILNKNFEELKELFPEIKFENYTEWLKNIEKLTDKDLIIKSFYNEVLDIHNIDINLNKDEILNTLDDLKKKTNKFDNYVDKAKLFIQNPKEIPLSFKKEYVNFFKENLSEINEKMLKNDIKDLNLLEKTIKLNEILSKNKDIEVLYKKIKNILFDDEKEIINIEINNNEIKEFNISKYNSIVNYLPSWLIPTLFNPIAITSSLQQLNLNLVPASNVMKIGNNIFTMIKSFINIITKSISLFTFINNTSINKLTNIMTTIVSSITLIAGAIALKSSWISLEDLIAMVLNAPKSIVGLIPTSIEVGSLEKININGGKNLSQHITDYINNKESETFKSWGKIQFFYPFQDYFNSGLKKIIEDISKQYIVIQFPPKISNLSKNNNYNAITTSTRSEQLFSYGGGSNITTELKFSYIANCLQRVEQKDALGEGLSTQKLLNNLKSNNIFSGIQGTLQKNFITLLQQFFSSKKDLISKKFKNYFENFFNITGLTDIELINNIKKELEKDYHNFELTKEQFVIFILTNVGNEKFFSELYNISVKEWSLIDIYVSYIKFLYLMYPYVNTDTKGNEQYIFPPLVKIKPRSQSLMFIDPPLLSSLNNFTNVQSILNLGKNTNIFEQNGDKDLSTYYVVNSVSIEFPENMYDRNFDLPSQLNISLGLTRVEKNIIDYAYNLKNLIG